MNRRLLVTALVVAAAAALVLASRCSSGDDSTQPSPSTASTAGPSLDTADEVDGHEDDGAVDTSDAPAVITTGPVDPREASIQVVVKLLNTTGRTADQWRAGLRPYVSDGLFAQLADADPETVPVGRADSSRVAVATAGDQLVVAAVPVVDPASPTRTVATIRVTLSGASHRWLATELDVERS
ncbi:hypothetical protein ACFFX1_55165 [Dactylosporangium sucinum]|uniref:Lipoprotein n=1 Tax=Dactylosporangium sucinum TaxID=1424081 RepID=A0A917X1N9_9ACTN|nr:hypothetical protein [Dactylosporangium sucinum]GGM52987.1 hypothetical protein GCM10007977_063270 [Dactylosporangium sucinum]